jgi:hypothetical protein
MVGDSGVPWFRKGKPVAMVGSSRDHPSHQMGASAVHPRYNGLQTAVSA